MKASRSATFIFLAPSLLACPDPFPNPGNLSELDQRIVTLENCIASGESGADIELKLAWSHYLRGNLLEADTGYKNILAKQPLLPRDAVAFALTLQDLKKFEEAHAVTASGKQGPWQALAHFVDGSALDSLGRSTEALAAFGRALDSDPLFMEARPMRARLYEEKGSIEDAWKDYNRILSVDAKNKQAIQNMGTLTSRLTRPPSELIPLKKIPSHHAVEVIPMGESGPILRVGIGTDGRGKIIERSTVTVQCAGSFQWVDGSGRSLLSGNPMEPWTITFVTNGVRVRSQDHDQTFPDVPITLAPDQPESTIILRELPFATGFSWSGLADREVRGTVEIRPGESGLRIINRVPLELYLYGVLPAEMPARFPTEALKAQAVLARSYALFQLTSRRPHRGQGYDLCDEQHCQVYGGVALEHAKATGAVDATRGEFLTYNGQPVHAVYSSNCGGQGQTGTEIGWGKVPYWAGTSEGPLPDDPPNAARFYCGPSTFTESVKSEWVRVTFPADVEEKAQRIKNIGPLKSITVSSRGPSQRVIELTVKGNQGQAVIREESAIRRVLGLAPLRSTLFTFDTVYRNDLPSLIIIQGRGWGHGVGFCQSGGAGRAQAGQSYVDILAHYFPGTQITQMNRRKT